MADDLHVAPDAAAGLCGQAADVLQGAVFEQLCECSAVCLTDDSELSTIVRGPA